MIGEIELERIAAQIEDSHLSGRALRREAMILLSSIDGYDWCGIYRLEGDALVLDEFVGAPTDHVRIPVGVGVCGTAVLENANQVVEDVAKRENYLACSTATRSEIVVLIHESQGGILGQIDIDGHVPGQFGPSDEAMLERVAAVLASKWQG